MLRQLKRLTAKKGLFIYNLGTGKGYSVLDVVKAFEKASGKKVPYQIMPRRAGDIATCYSHPSKALKELGWKAERILKKCARTAGAGKARIRTVIPINNKYKD